MIRYNNADHGRAIAERAKCIYSERDVVISREEDGKLLGGSIFQDYAGRSIAIHVAGFHPRWINRDILFATFYYPFVTLGCERLFGYVPSKNKRAQEFDKKLGFEEVCRIPGVFWDSDLIVFAMTADKCRFIKTNGLRKHG